MLPKQLVGLAFEVKDATLKCRKASKEEYEQIPYHEKELAEITLKNIFGYCFNYVSVFSGPYFTYRTYRDSFVEKYSSDEKLAEACDSNTVETFKSIVIVIVLYVLLSYLWPPRRIFEDEFYTDQSFIFRLWYMCLVCFINRMKLYFGLIVSQCVCSAAGVGAYPSVFQSTPGQGPRTKDPQLLENWDGTYDFNTIKNCDIYTVETCWTFQELAKCWHMSIQYWLYVNVYKRVPNRKLRLVGLAFEVKDATLKCRKASKEEYEQIPYHEKELAEITLRNIFGYCFSYVVNTEIYLTYRTYRDSIVEKYSSDEKLDEACERHIAEKFKLIPILTVLYFTLIYFWPFERMFEDEFYTEQSILFRIWYIWIAFIIFRLKMYIIMIVSDCITSAAGVGAYPSVFQSTPGGGPRTKDPGLLEDWDGTYDFNTIKNCDIYTVETCLTSRESIRSWNMCVQYWLVMYVYKRFPIRNLRAVATVVVSAFWHGNNLGYHFCIVLSVFYIVIEDQCLKRLRSSFPVFPFWLKGCVWFFKFFAFSYLAIPFQLVIFSRFWRYYSSVYHFGYIIFGCQYVLALFWPKISIIFLGRKPRRSE
uniref:Lysophospholipid acyltransferase 7 n=1 Tax=Phlebotomus papatasi TaxID=29031 RepID=A0A1B0GQI8_PHLPP